MTGSAGNGIIQRKVLIIKQYPSKRGSVIGYRIGTRRIDLTNNIGGGQVAWQGLIGIIKGGGRQVQHGSYCVVG